MPSVSMGLVVHPELGGAALRPLPPPPRPMLGQGGPHLLGGYVGGLGPMRRPSAGSMARRGRYRHDGSYDGTPRSRSGDDDSPAPPRRLEIAWTFETPPSAGSQRAPPAVVAVAAAPPALLLPPPPAVVPPVVGGALAQAGPPLPLAPAPPPPPRPASAPPAPPPAAAALASIGATARAMADSAPVLTTAAARAKATDAGEVLSLTQIRQCEKHRAAAELAAILPPYAFTRMLSSSAARVAARTPEDAASKVVRIIAQTGRTTITGATSAWSRMLKWADDCGVSTGARFDGLDTSDFLDHVHKVALEKVAKAKLAHDEANARRVARGQDPKPQSKNKRDGSSARATVETSLKWLRKVCCVEVDVGAPLIGVGRVGRRKPEGSEPMGVRLAVGLERSAVRHGGVQGANAFVAGQSAAHLATGFGSLRLEQSNFCMLEFEDEGVVHGVVGKDKHPDPSKQQARPFWLPIDGLVHGRAWLDALYAALEGVEEGCFLLRDTDSPDGDPRRATRWVNAPCTGNRALVSLRACAEEAGLPSGEAKLYGNSSGRRLLPEVAEARHEPAPRRVEIGRWSGSTAQDRDLTPAQRATLRHAAKVAVLPDRYARRAKVTRVVGIVLEQMEALRSLVGSRPLPELPYRAGWELLSRCPSANLEPEPLEVIGGEALEEEPWRQTTDPAV